jgi:hypothetical protein
MIGRVVFIVVFYYLAFFNSVNMVLFLAVHVVSNCLVTQDQIVASKIITWAL